jgi:hypothetical protein
MFEIFVQYHAALSNIGGPRMLDDVEFVWTQLNDKLMDFLDGDFESKFYTFIKT